MEDTPCPWSGQSNTCRHDSGARLLPAPLTPKCRHTVCMDWSLPHHRLTGQPAVVIRPPLIRPSPARFLPVDQLPNEIRPRIVSHRDGCTAVNITCPTLQSQDDSERVLWRHIQLKPEYVKAIGLDRHRLREGPVATPICVTQMLCIVTNPT